MYKHTIKKFLIILCLPLLLFGSNYTFAAEASLWRAGNIIDDRSFYNNLEMTADDVQRFLNDRVPSCDNWGSKAYSGSQTRAQFSASQGRPAPFTCLRDYFENPTTKENNSQDFRHRPVGGLSAAQIIKQAADTYNINPKVLIVTLQKENSLITDDWPWTNQYRNAMGFGCPDTAPCDPSYAGFYNQVMNAARQFRLYANNPNSYNHVAYRNNTVRYNPNSACGSSTVYIESTATAGLYNYTPYQPNNPALNNLYGTGDGCSAYGNRNFWRMYIDWFGSVYSGPELHVTGAINPDPQLYPGEITTAYIDIQNLTGDMWYADGFVPAGKTATRIATINYQSSPFANTGSSEWLGTSSQVKMMTPSVPPNGIASFKITFRGPTTRQNLPFKFTLVKDGVRFYKDIGMQFDLSSAPDYEYQLLSNTTPTSIVANDTWRSAITVRNTGFSAWSSSNTRLRSLSGRQNPYAHRASGHPGWHEDYISIYPAEAIIQPGEIATFEHTIYAPPFQNNFSDTYAVYVNNSRATGSHASMSINTAPPRYMYSFYSAINPPYIMQRNSTANAVIKLLNTGSTVWRNDVDKNPRIGYGSIRLVGARPWYSANALADILSPTWLGTQSQASMVEPSVTPGQIGTFNIPYKAPSVPGVYNWKFAPVIDGVQVLSDIGMEFTVIVQ